MTSHSQRRVLNNTIVSGALPALEIKVDATFEFVGVFARIVDDARRHEIIIFYQETLGSLGLTLETYSQLSTEKQQDFENALTERSLQNFQVTDLG
ncbi:MAG TPA: hypothetical protein VN653_12410 [Anaerolineales bacterium]|nr:hypothetical protein [Anaerolineales bacterium]